MIVVYPHQYGSLKLIAVYCNQGKIALGAAVYLYPTGYAGGV